MLTLWPQIRGSGAFRSTSCVADAAVPVAATYLCHLGGYSFCHSCKRPAQTSGAPGPLSVFQVWLRWGCFALSRIATASPCKPSQGAPFRLHRVQLLAMPGPPMMFPFSRPGFLQWFRAQRLLFLDDLYFVLLQVVLKAAVVYSKWDAFKRIRRYTTSSMRADTTGYIRVWNNHLRRSASNLDSKRSLKICKRQQMQPTGMIPERSTRSSHYPSDLIPKPGKSGDDPVRFRPNTLLSHLGKTILGVLVQRVQPKVRSYLEGPPQYAYVTHRTYKQAFQRACSHCHEVRTLNFVNENEGHSTTNSKAINQDSALGSDDMRRPGTGIRPCSTRTATAGHDCSLFPSG